MRAPLSNRIAMIGALAFACASANAAPLLTNGDFELDASDVAVGGYLRVGAGETTIDGWTVTGNSVDLIRSAYGAISNVSVDLAGTPGPGGIEQSFTAQAGYSYRLTWDYYTNGANPINLTVGLGSASLVVPNAPAAITTAFLDFVAPTSGSYVVRFATSNSSNNGPTVDNIRLAVNAVPEPAGWTLLVAGLGIVLVAARRRREGHAGS